MKRLLVAMAAVAAVATAFAKITATNEFESSFADFVADTADEDASELASYASDAPVFSAPYPCSGFGAKYLSLDTGNATLWRTNATEGDVCFDMAMQFNSRTSEPAVAADTKIAVYLNSSSNLVVIAGTSANDRTPKSYVTTTEVVPGSWKRLTISSENTESGLEFTVRLDGTVLTADSTSAFPCLTDDTTVREIGFAGTGALDDYVARTTNPYVHPANYIARVGSTDDGEYYETFADALADGQTAITSTTYRFRTANGEDYDAATNPYVIANVEDLLALMYVGDKTKNYRQTANIDMTDVAPFLGIGVSDDEVAAGVAFTGVYDGGNYTISNVTLAESEYAGIFRKVYGTVKNLTVNNMSFGSSPSTGSYGCAIVGEADNNAVLQNLTATGTFCGAGDAGARHNTAGIVVVVQTAAGNGTVTIRDCVNNATVYGRHHRVGGILAYTRNEGNVVISNCVNNGTLVWTSKTNPTNPRGIAGIVACPEGTGTVTIMDCTNTGTFTVNNANSAENAAAATGDIVGYFYGLSSSGTFVEDGGNTYRAAGKLCGTVANTVTVTKCQYAVASTVDNVDYLTTVKAIDLAAGGTYTLLDNIAASATPVVELVAGETIAFNTNGFNFAGTVAVSNPNMMDVTSQTLGSVITFTAAAGTAVASITKGEVTTEYNTLAKALAAAESGDTVTLLADNTAAFSIPAGVTVDCSTCVNTGTIGGFGTIKVNASPASDPVFASDWTGTYQINWMLAGATDITVYGNANSTIEIAAATSDATSGNDRFYFSTSDNKAPTVNSTLKLSATVTINNGWMDQTTTIKKLTGNGDLVFYSTPITYKAYPFAVTDIEDYTGTIRGYRDGVIIGNINNDAADFGVCLVKYNGAKGLDVTNTQLNSATADLCVDTLGNQKGVYKTAARATCEGVATGYASVANAIAAVGSPVGNTTVPTIVVYDGSSAEYSGWTRDGSTYTYGSVRAKIGETGYGTLTLALNAAGTEAETEIDLVGACSETVAIPGNVTVAVGSGVAFAGTISGNGKIVYTAEPSGTLKFDEWTGTVNLNYADIVSDADFAAVANARGVAGSIVEIGESGSASGYMNADLKPSLKVSGFMEFKNGSTSRQPSIPALTGDGVVVFTYFYNNGGETTKYAVSRLVDWDGVITNNSSVAFVTNIVSGSGTVIYNKKPTSVPTVASEWTGTVAAGWNETVAAGAKGPAFDINGYGNESSIVEVTGDIQGGHAIMSDADTRILPTLKVTGSLKLDNGYSGKITTFRNVTGSGNLTFEDYGCKVETLDHFTGVLATSLDTFTSSNTSISNILTDVELAAGALVLKMTSNTKIWNVASIEVNGSNEKVLEFIADGAEGAGLYVKDTTVYVAQIGETKYATLTGAVAAATSDATVTLLSNITLDARVEPNLGENTTLTIDLGGYTITRDGTSGNGSVFDVKSGTVTITNGVINCTQNDAAIAKDGVYAITARSGAVLTLDALTVTVNSECGACVYPFSGATVAILGGTYANNTTTPYRYKDAWTGMAVNQANVATQLIAIYGGSFKQVNPALGDDSWADGEGTFLATGKTTTLEGGYWVVGTAPSDPWNTPDSAAGVADALSTDGLVTESAAVTTVAGFNALVNYIETKLNVTAPGQMTANQKANAVLCYALNATTIPDTEIKSVTIDAITQPDANGAMTLTVAIPDVTVGEAVDASLLAKVVSAKGGTALGSMSAENVTVSGCVAANGKVVITVTPKVSAGDPAPTTFFTSAVITK